LLSASVANADVVVQRWGTGRFVQHQTVKYQRGKDGTQLIADLAPLPKGAEVYRARLVFNSGEGYEVSYQDDAGTAKALELVGPYYLWFDATAAVRQAAKQGQPVVLTIQKPDKFKPDDAYLEIAYEGKLADRSQQVSNVKAFYRSGQVFLTWKEIWDIAGGNPEVRWGEMVNKVKTCTPLGITPVEKDREIRYHVYRHSEPITGRNIGRARFLYAVKPGSVYTDEAVPWAVEGEHGPVYLQKGNVQGRVTLDPDKPLPPGTGFHWHTAEKPGKGYYAVVTAVNGVENTLDLSGQNTAGPFEEKVETPEPILYRDVVKKVRGPKGQEAEHHEQWYTWWVPPPLSPYPKRYDLVISYCPGTMLKPAPLVLTRGHAWITVPEPPGAGPHQGVYLAPSANNPCAFWMGIPDSYYTLKSKEQGKWRPQEQMRNDVLIRWVKGKFPIDDNRIVGEIGCWGMMEIERNDLYAWLHGWGEPEMTKGFQSWGRAQIWGSPSIYANRPKEENPWLRQDYSRWILENPTVETPFFALHTGWGAHFSEMGWPPFPRFLRAMIDTKRPFVFQSHVFDKLPVIRRDQSVPAFGNCSLDDNVGNGDPHNGIAYGQINGYLNWDSATIVDQPGQWEMTVWLDASAPLPQCTVDLTPRRCQQFKARPGVKLSWSSATVEDGQSLGSGEIAADRWGLATVEKLTVGKAKHRVMIKRK
jgi:hypothetical protein